MSKRPRELPPLIALVGCDGSGKSTVIAHLAVFARSFGPAEAVHLGRQAGNVGRAAARWPLIGRLIGRLIARKVHKVHGQRDHNRTPGLLSALVISAFSVRLRHRFRRMLALRRQGFIILADRFPQTEVSGAHDGPNLPSGARGNPIVRWLGRREHKLFAWMTSRPPDLLLRLNVDLDTACARKPDHDRESLRAKLELIPKLTYQASAIVDIDATRPLSEVLTSAEAALAGLLEQRGYTRDEAVPTLANAAGQ